MNSNIKTGYLPLSVVEGVFVADFIEELTNDPDFLLYATCEQKNLVKDLIDLVLSNEKITAKMISSHKSSRIFTNFGFFRGKISRCRH